MLVFCTDAHKIKFFPSQNFLLPSILSMLQNITVAAAVSSSSCIFFLEATYNQVQILSMSNLLDIISKVLHHHHVYNCCLPDL
jgi:hypothetical protein